MPYHAYANLLLLSPFLFSQKTWGQAKRNSGDVITILPEYGDFNCFLADFGYNAL